MPYNYVAAPDSAPFSEAPLPIMESLNRLTWAGNVVANGRSYPPRNELLAVGYMETQKMGVSVTQLTNHCGCSLIQCSFTMMERKSWMI